MYRSHKVSYIVNFSPIISLITTYLVKVVVRIIFREILCDVYEYQ